MNPTSPDASIQLPSRPRYNGARYYSLTVRASSASYTEFCIVHGKLGKAVENTGNYVQTSPGPVCYLVYVGFNVAT